MMNDGPNVLLEEGNITLDLLYRLIRHEIIRFFTQ